MPFVNFKIIFSLKIRMSYPFNMLHITVSFSLNLFLSFIASNSKQIAPLFILHGSPQVVSVLGTEYVANVFY